MVLKRVVYPWSNKYKPICFPVKVTIQPRSKEASTRNNIFREMAMYTKIYFNQFITMYHLKTCKYFMKLNKQNILTIFTNSVRNSVQKFIFSLRYRWKEQHNFTNLHNCLKSTPPYLTNTESSFLRFAVTALIFQPS